VAGQPTDAQRFCNARHQAALSGALHGFDRNSSAGRVART
jgi:hypothetical protein